MNTQNVNWTASLPFELQTNLIYKPQKKYSTYFILAFFFGPYGVHNFYYGYMTRGIIQASITALADLIINGVALVTFGFGSLFSICFLVMRIWALAECIIFREPANDQGLSIIDISTNDANQSAYGAQSSYRAGNNMQ